MLSNSEQPSNNNSTGNVGSPPTFVPNGGPIRLNGIKGYLTRTNHVIYCPPLIRTSNNNKDEGPGSAVVYFGGDVQDIPENMEDNRDTKGYVKYNLDNTAVILRDSFPKSHIVVIRPARMEFTTFSCFDNFVRGNNVGIPDHTPMHNALQHLEEILINITKKLKSMPATELVSKLMEASPTTVNSDSSEDMHIDILQVHDNVNADSDNAMGFSCTSLPTIPIPADLTPDLLQADIQSSALTTATTTTSSTTETSSTNISNSTNPRDPHDLLWWRDNINLDKAQLSLIGFSKGCVVLNQFIYEFHYLKTLTPDDVSMMRLVSRIKHMYWLDGGHGGGKNTWITSRSLLETLCRLGISIHVHVTPYQVQDDHRPWIRKEEKSFTDLLRKLGCSLTRHLHSTESTCSNLFTHFEVLENFRLHQIHEIQNQIQQQLQQQEQQLTQPQNQDSQNNVDNNQSPPSANPTESEESHDNQIIQKTPPNDSEAETKLAENTEA